MVINLKKNIKNISVNYELYGEGDDTIVLLHGWGQNIEMMKPIGDRMCYNHQILIIDLPGHGLSDEPDFAWSLYDYVEMLKMLFEELSLKKIILIGHSFGGKISLLYSSMYKVEKVVVFGSPFKKKIQKDSFKLKMLKFFKRIPGINKLEDVAKKHIGSTDYKNASKVMREVLVNHVNLDITEEVKKIQAPLLIVWGTSDQAVPIEDAYELEKLVPGAGLVVYPNCTHYAYLENLSQTINVLKSFLD